MVSNDWHCPCSEFGLKKTAVVGLCGMLNVLGLKQMAAAEDVFVSGVIE
jgi:hypothetical protein